MDAKLINLLKSIASGYGDPVDVEFQFENILGEALKLGLLRVTQGRDDMHEFTRVALTPEGWAIVKANR